VKKYVVSTKIEQDRVYMEHDRTNWWATHFGEDGDVLASRNQVRSTSRRDRTWRFRLSRDCAVSPLCEKGTRLRFMGEQHYPETIDSSALQTGLLHDSIL